VPKNNWRGYEADNLTLTWPAYNLTFDMNSQVDVTLWGYWEDVEKHEFVEVHINPVRIFGTASLMGQVVIDRLYCQKSAQQGQLLLQSPHPYQDGYDVRRLEEVQLWGVAGATLH